MARTIAPLNRLRVAVAAGVLLLAGIVVGVALTRGDGGRPAIPRVGGYSVEYRIEDRTQSPPRVTTETVDVSRPFRTRRLLRAGTRPLGGSITTEDGVYTVRADGSVQLIQAVAPGEAGSDLRLRPTLAFAEAHQLARRDSLGRIVNRACVWWITRDPLDSSAVAPATAKDSTRSCVDGTGLLLAESWRVGGVEVRTRQAVRIEDAPDLSGDAIFDGHQPAPLQSSLATTSVGKRPGPVDQPYAAAGQPPEGFELAVAADVADADPTTAPPTIQRETQRSVYRRDDDILVVDQIRSHTGKLTAATGVPVSLGALGTGTVRGTPAGLIAEVLAPSGALLRVRTDMEEAELVSWLRSLTPA